MVAETTALKGGLMPPAPIRIEGGSIIFTADEALRAGSVALRDAPDFDVRSAQRQIASAMESNPGDEISISPRHGTALYVLYLCSAVETIGHQWRGGELSDASHQDLMGYYACMGTLRAFRPPLTDERIYGRSDPDYHHYP